MPIKNKILITHHDIVVGHLVEIGAALCISELTDADTVRGVQLLHEEATTSLNHL